MTTSPRAEVKKDTVRQKGTVDDASAAKTTRPK
jgi:hypothetical protein